MEDTVTREWRMEDREWMMSILAHDALCHPLSSIRHLPSSIFYSPHSLDIPAVPTDAQRTMYEVFEHTADAGLRIEAPDLDTLFVEAARGFNSLVIENPDAIRPVVEEEIRVEGAAPDYLLFDWLNELLFRFDSEKRLFSEFTVTRDELGLTAKVRGETFDPERHQPAHEIKAITYHQLEVKQTANGWEGRVIVDI